VERVTITIDEELLEAIDALVVRKGYASRSEAVRDGSVKSLGQRLPVPG